MRNAILGLGLFLALASGARADNIPDCFGNAGAIAIDNQQVILWKTTTRNQFQARAHVKGVIRQVFPDHSGHHHFELVLGQNPGDDVEIIFNEDFGATPPLQPGMSVEACGDYITSTDQSGPYPPSPDNAIIHWVHRSPNLQRHASGFIAVNGTVYGQDTSNAGPKRRF